MSTLKTPLKALDRNVSNTDVVIGDHGDGSVKQEFNSVVLKEVSLNSY